MLTSTGVGSVDQDLVIAQEPCLMWLRPLGSTLAANFVGHWRGTGVQEHSSLEEKRGEGTCYAGDPVTTKWLHWDPLLVFVVGLVYQPYSHIRAS